MIKSFVSIAILIFLLSACSEETKTTSESTTNTEEGMGFSLIPSAKSGITFKNNIVESEELNHLTWDAFFYGGGVSIGDLDDDGLPDIYFTGNQTSDVIYKNLGGLKFQDVTPQLIKEEVSWSNGVTMADVNGDGLLDIYVSKTHWGKDKEKVELRKNKLYINKGGMTFNEEAEAFGLDNESYSTQASFFDYDGDSDLDVFLLNSPSNNLQQKVEYSTSEFPDFCTDRLLRNDGASFTDITTEAGVHALSFGLGVITQDLNHDGLTDIYVANDYEKPDYYYINNGNGTFTNKLDQNFKHTSNTAMGVDAGDINNDALSDLCVLDMQSESHYRSKTNMPSMSTETFFNYVSKGYNYQYMTNVLQKNNGTGFFSDIAQMAGISSTDWSWSVLIEDYDHDGMNDIFITNGINRDIRNNDFSQEFDKLLENNERIDLFELANKTPSTKISNYLYSNNGDFTFSNKSEDWNTNHPSFSYGAAYGDLDNDGDLDLVVNNNEEEPFLYENLTSGNNWISIKIKGKGKNTRGLNSKAIIFSNGKKHYKELSPTRGYQSSVEDKFNFGLGKCAKIDSLIIIFQDGSTVKKFDVLTNQELIINETDSKRQPIKVYDFQAPSFKRVAQSIGLETAHKENDFDDWENEILLPHRESRNGPKMASGDLNGDGLDDIVICSAAGQTPTVYSQTGTGFSETNGTWMESKLQENVDVQILDFNADGLLDFYLVNGGNHLPKDHEDYKDELFLNSPSGFAKQITTETINGSCAAIGDINNDGFTDLFIAGNNTPNSYPNSDGNVIYFGNKEGSLSVSASLTENTPLGMIKDAQLIDLNNDSYPELIVLGHWMSPTILWNNEGVFDKFSPVGNLNGWWYSLEPSDVNGDGHIDFICGNMGLNNKYHPSSEKPLKLYQSDFDNNNTNDIVLAKPFEGKYVPVRGRECSSEQMPFLEDEFENYEGFANASIEEVLGEDKISKAAFFQVNEFRSGILLNDGNGKFNFKPFPNLVQSFPVLDIVTHDLNNDGKLDFILAGNHYDAEVETTRHDSGNGLILMSTQTEEHLVLTGIESGFFAQGNVKSLLKMKLGKRDLLLVGNNNSKIGAYFIE